MKLKILGGKARGFLFWHVQYGTKICSSRGVRIAPLQEGVQKSFSIRRESIKLPTCRQPIDDAARCKAVGDCYLVRLCKLQTISTI